MNAACGQERSRCLQIVGFGKACELCEQEMAADAARLSAMRDRLHTTINAINALEEVYLNGHPTERLPHNLNISFVHVEGESLLMGCKEIALLFFRLGLHRRHWNRPMSCAPWG
ncbi:MAG: hypothetical protein MRJ92_00775 [Nitrospira sp.]|nr:hypothetical protein [Nitrospira sp.]